MAREASAGTGACVSGLSLYLSLPPRLTLRPCEPAWSSRLPPPTSLSEAHHLASGGII